VPHVDVRSGQIMDIHDGNTLLINGTFFWFGAGLLAVAVCGAAWVTV
jgi:hypothetical protein